MATSRRTCFVSYELHPATLGGCGVLLHHAAELLLEQGHEILFLLDFDRALVDRYQSTDRLALPNPERCTVVAVEDLLDGFPWSEAEVACPFQYKALRFGFAVQALLERERVDAVEFFEYCGAGYYAFARKLYGRIPGEVALGTRLHGSIELIDSHESAQVLTVDRYVLHALERRALDLSEFVLAPSRAYVEAYGPDAGLDSSKVAVSQPPRRPFPRVSRADPEQRSDVTFLGRLCPLKGADKLLNAAMEWMRADPSFDGCIVFIGPDTKDPDGGSHLESLRRAIPAPWSDRFIFTGALDHEQVASRLSTARFAVFANEYESFCYALHEVYHAGIPVLISNLPGFGEFFRDGYNARVHDGSVDGLIQAMRALWHDASALRSLSCPEEVAVEPLGEWYSRALALAPIVAAPLAPDPRVLVVVLAKPGSELASTLTALDGQQCPAERILLLHELGAHSTSAPDSERLPFLGQHWSVEVRGGESRRTDSDGRSSREASEALRSQEAILVLEAGDRPRPEFLSLARTALRNRPSLAFAGTWLSHEGIVQPTTIDIAPELHPFRFGPQLTRTVLRTTPGRALVDLFDPRHGAYGEIGHLWKVWSSVGPGCLLPEIGMEVVDAAPRPADPTCLSFLVMNERDPERLRRLARFSAVIQQDAAAEPPSSRRMKRLALRTLSAGTLFKLALKRLWFARR